MMLTVEEHDYCKRFGNLIKPGFIDAQRAMTVAREVDAYSDREPRFVATRM